MGEERGVYRVLVGKPEGKKPLGIPRRRRVDNIRIDLQEVGCGYMDWIGLAQDLSMIDQLVKQYCRLYFTIYISCTVNDLEILTVPTKAQVYYYVFHS
jgi:hypothetical protein